MVVGWVVTVAILSQSNDGARTPLPHPPVAAVGDNGVAVVTRVVSVDWGGADVKKVGDTLPPGMLVLKQGLLQLEFYSGALLVLEGPAKLDLISADEVICHKGKVRAHVPPPAHGFTVLSPQFELVDLGTEFGVEVGANGATEVHVFDGKS